MNSTSAIYFSYARANREPNRNDFESWNVKHVKPEQLNDFELGWRHSTPKKLSINTNALLYVCIMNQLVLNWTY